VHHELHDAAKAVGKVLPSVNDKLTGIAFRMPTQESSVEHLTCHLEKGIKFADFDSAFKEAMAGDMNGVLDRLDEEVMSKDFARC
jgi:glyceraldehyde 3-phosphate dehydrogenase